MIFMLECFLQKMYALCCMHRKMFMQLLIHVK